MTNSAVLKVAIGLILLSSQVRAENYIVGGESVNSQDPIQASTVGIFDPSPDGKSGSLCTGTLVRRDMALTAAHCISNSQTEPSLIFGPNLHSPSAPHRQADAVAINPKWKTHAGKGMDQGDIALVKFRGGLPKGYKTISAVGSDQEIHAGSEVTLAGYGISDAQKKTGAGELRETQVPILKNRPGKSEMILDQSHGRGACHGDSGGPAFLRRGNKMVLAGVTNRGYPNRAPDDCRHQVVYTKVPAYRSWIQSSEKKLAAKRSSRAPESLRKNSKALATTRLKSRSILAKTKRRLSSRRH